MLEANNITEKKKIFNFVAGIKLIKILFENLKIKIPKTKLKI